MTSDSIAFVNKYATKLELKRSERTEFSICDAFDVNHIFDDHKKDNPQRPSKTPLVFDEELSVIDEHDEELIENYFRWHEKFAAERDIYLNYFDFIVLTIAQLPDTSNHVTKSNIDRKEILAKFGSLVTNNDNFVQFNKH